jgi:glutamate synthase (NADPH/NADH) large chain
MMKQTMYRPSFEKDACGMGFIAQRDGKASRKLIDYALMMLERMNHRGGTGAEADTGDGAGILMAMPDRFFRKEALKLGVHLPKQSEYAVAMLFLPKDKEEKHSLQQSMVKDISAAGFRILLEREVPYAFYQCGPGAQKVMPSFVQLFIEKPIDVNAGRQFEASKKVIKLTSYRFVVYPAKRLFIRGCCMPIKSDYFSQIYKIPKWRQVLL